jgi:hypothetical protein
MKKTVDALSNEVTKARTYLDRVRQRESTAALTTQGSASDVKL